MTRIAVLPVRRGRLARGLVALSVAVMGVTLGAPAAQGARGPRASTPNDPLYRYQWGPQQVRAPAAWGTTDGRGAVIAIVDTGVDLDHPDLDKNVIPGNTFLDCGDQGCGNGDWQSGPNPGDEIGHPHGTHVAGIAAAATGNRRGIAGVAPRAKLLAVRVLDSDGSGSFEDVARGIRWSADHRADVVNLSLGALPGVQAFTITGLLDDVVEAIAYANSRGVVVVAASGNEAVPLCDTPGFDPGAVCVTGTDRREAKAWYANNPVNSDLVSVAAPGGAGVFVICYEEILSTVPPGEGGDYCDYPEDLSYDEYAGTSMATPHAAGVAGLLASLGCAREDNVAVLTSTARTPATGQRGVWTPEYGFGIVDAEAGVRQALTDC